MNSFQAKETQVESGETESRSQAAAPSAAPSMNGKVGFQWPDGQVIGFSSHKGNYTS